MKDVDAIPVTAGNFAGEKGLAELGPIGSSWVQWRTHLGKTAYPLARTGPGCILSLSFFLFWLQDQTDLCAGDLGKGVWGDGNGDRDGRDLASSAGVACTCTIHLEQMQQDAFISMVSILSFVFRPDPISGNLRIHP